MKIYIDQNNLLTIQNPNIPQVKEYTYNVWGYRFSDFDKWIIVYHKKEFKIINLKNLWYNMGVIYLSSKLKVKSSKLDLDSFVSWICNYRSYDEETGKSYYFLPKINEKELDNLNKYLSKLWTDIKLEKTNKWIIVDFKGEKTNTENTLSKFFAWTLLYGKLDIKKDAKTSQEVFIPKQVLQRRPYQALLGKRWELLSFKFHLPLFGAYLAQREDLDNQINELNKNWIFVKKDILETKDWIVYQVSGNDYQILQSFANWYQSIENINKIPKYDEALEIKEKLIQFIKSNSEIPEEGKNETIKLLKNSIIKILIK